MKSYYIFDRETNRLYHTTIDTDSMQDLLVKFAKWDMEGDEEAINELLVDIKNDKDADDYFQDRGSIVLEADSVEEF